MKTSLKCFMSAASAAACLFGSNLAAQAQTQEYGRSGPWTILTEEHIPSSCRANMTNNRLQRDFGQFFSIVLNGRDWELWTDYRIDDRTTTSILIDRKSFEATFEQVENVAVAPVGQDVVDAMRSARSINLNLDPEGPIYALRGSGAAIQMVEECARSHGLQNAGNSGTNDYGGYDIGGVPEAEETNYGTARGWRVVAATVAGNFAYCAGETDDRGTIWRMGWDGMQWQVAVAADVRPDWNGYLDVDGDSRPISGSAGGGWALLWLGMQELDKIRNGNTMVVDTGGASIRHRLIGTAAVATKIEECVQRRGGGAVAVAEPKPAQQTEAGNGGMPGDPSCPDDGPRLPFTGICAGRAVNYLTGTPTYGDYLPDPECEWVVNEVQVVEDALLYRALRCKGVTAQLEYAGGAQWAQLMVVRSALNAAYGEKPDVSDPRPLVWFNWIDPNNIKRDLDMRSRQGAEAELRGRKCAIRKADPATSPDGYVFDITSADPMYERQRQEPTPPLCGSFSEGDGVVRFWRVLGEFAFLFDLSADIYQDIDPNTVTLLKRQADGGWAAVQ
ncbi:hypothetical protein [Propylenella binzhouense]|uniref:CUB domain-containing protein n=1 Tax=Propylenella binzhouense TaxID=2555902 RepID=A0A964WS09_9HYPH|nr:hypothetical protein [Propylenella binzhouense]MYZ46474.1 hypothetical protein [Propylenella binzhouense]